MHLLENVAFWNTFRTGLDRVFGMYRQGEAHIRSFGITRKMSLLDVGCGTGQYARMTDAEYLGIDTDCRYIAYARRRYGGPRKQFLCGKVEDSILNGKTFDVTLLIDVTHHVPTPELRPLLAVLAKITTRYLVIFDPIQQKPENRIGKFLAARDRGKYIRTAEDELALIAERFTIQRVVKTKLLSVDGMVVLAQPR